MTSAFTGFSEEDLQRIKTEESEVINDLDGSATPKKITKIGAKAKKPVLDYKLNLTHNVNLADSTDDINFEKCKLSLKANSADVTNNNESSSNSDIDITDNMNSSRKTSLEDVRTPENSSVFSSRKNSCVETPETPNFGNNYTENELAAHKAKLEELQLRQKIMEEQNKKRKEMLAKALADRTKQTAEEVLKLEKIKKELQILDGQLSQDVAVLRKKIDQSCLCYADAEKHYLKAEKEFLQAKLNLQKQKEQKELLTEHLCALITHNETRKAKKLEMLMLQLTSDEMMVDGTSDSEGIESPVVVDGVDVRTGKMVEFRPGS